jgi:hypothetical protein
MKLEPNDRIAVSQKQVNLNSSVITTGELVCVNGNTATVLLEGEAVAREVPLASVVAADALMGSLSDRRNEQSIINMLPR